MGSFHRQPKSLLLPQQWRGGTELLGTQELRTGRTEWVTTRRGHFQGPARATGQAKADAYRVGVESLGSQNYALLQLMQIIGERNVRVVPDVAVTGAQGANGLMDALMALMVRRDVEAAETRKILHN